MSNPSWITRSQDGSAAFLENRTTVMTVTEGHGTGNDCAYCHKTVEPTAVEHRVEAVVLGGGRTLYFHRICHHLWESQGQDQRVP